VGQGAGQPGFTDTGGAADDQVEAVAQPLTTAQLQDQGSSQKTENKAR